MPRKSFVELAADLATAFPDNTTGLITPATVRTYFNNFLDAIRPAYGVLSRPVAAVQVVNTTPAPVVFDTGSVSGVPDFTTTPATGIVTRLEKGSTRITFNATLEGANGRLLTFALYKNGVITPWRASASLLGTGKPVDVSITALLYEGASAIYQLQVNADAAGVSVTFSNMDMLCETVPVNSYT